MIYNIKCEEGPAYYHRREIRVEAPTEAIAIYKLLAVIPTMKIISVEPVGELE